jgi:acetyl esterase/lipase
VRQIPNRDGTLLKAICWSPENPNTPGPLIITFHGGGFIAGTPEYHVAEAAATVTGFGATYVSVAYRLAPEHPFPAAPHDAIDSVKWAYEHASGSPLNADVSKGFVIGGVSAGGMLATVASLWARDYGIPLTGTCLTWSLVIDHRNVPEKWKQQYLSREECKDAPLLDRATMDFYLSKATPFSSSARSRSDEIDD